MNEKLAAKVLAVNSANANAKRYHNEIKAALTPFVGQKIEKVDGSLLAKVKAALPELPNTPKLQVFFNPMSHSTLAWTVKASASYSIGDGTTTCIAVYHSTYVYMGDLKGGVLTALSPDQTTQTGWRADYTVEEVETLRVAYRNAKDAASSALSKLGGFGEYDT